MSASGNFSTFNTVTKHDCFVLLSVLILALCLFEIMEDKIDHNQFTFSEASNHTVISTKMYALQIYSIIYTVFIATF